MLVTLDINANIETFERRSALQDGIKEGNTPRGSFPLSGMTRMNSKPSMSPKSGKFIY